MASCGQRHYCTPWRYGRNFCVECSIDALKLDPEAVLEPLLEKLELYTLRVDCASKVVSALLGSAKSLTFPASLIPVAATAIEVVLSKLRPLDSRDVCAELLTKCLKIMEDDPPRCPRVSLARIVVSQSVVAAGRVERLLSAVPERVVKLMICPRIEEDLRLDLLQTVAMQQPLHQLMETLLEELRIVASTDGATAVLDILRLILLQTDDKLEKDEILSPHISWLHHKLSHCLMSRDAVLQFSAVNFTKCLVCQNESHANSVLQHGDLCDAMMDPLLSYDTNVVRATLSMLSELSTNAQIYQDNKAKVFLKSIMAKLEKTCDDFDNSFCCVRLLGQLVQNATIHNCDILEDCANEIFELTWHLLLSEDETVSHAAAHLALDLISARQIPGVKWNVDVLHLAQLAIVKDACPKEDSDLCNCFTQRVAISLIYWFNDDDEDKINVELGKWMTEQIVEHAANCALNAECSSGRKILRLSKAVKTLLSPRKWSGKFEFATQIANVGFLDYFLSNKAHLSIACEPLSMVLQLLCETHLGVSLDLEMLNEHLVQGFASSYDFDSANMQLCILYCWALHSSSDNPALADEIPNVAKFLNYCNYRFISNHMAKAAVFVLAVASKGHAGKLPDCVVRLVSRWAANPESLYTDHAVYVSWVLQLQHQQIPQEFLISTLQRWLSMDRRDSDVLCSYANATIFMEVMVGSDNITAALGAMAALHEAIECEDEKLPLTELLWMKLPSYLMKKSAQNYEGNYGHALLLRLAISNFPQENCVMPLEESWSVLPEFIAQLLLQKPGDRKWSVSTLDSAFTIANHILASSDEADLSQKTKLKLFIKVTIFLPSLEKFINSEPISSAHISALEFVTALINAHESCLKKMNSPKVLECISLDSKVLLQALQAKSQSCELIRAVICLVDAIILSSPLLNHLVSIKVESSEALAQFAAEFYKLVHLSIALHPGSEIESSGWSCLRQLLLWGVDKWLCRTPWTHLLLWTVELPSKSELATRNMLLYLKSFFKTLDESHKIRVQGKEKPVGSEAKLTNKTAKRLVACASSLAYLQNCRRGVYEVLKLVLKLDYELQEEVKLLISSKLSELKYGG
ncbi:uncharacterized protein LOC132201719 [Neocloeon triangulifer]|uniref:uncharacterized protein LOC132201719 n=1 Tax=Neocloeon triangulifer TaxID=2078957 RepID=UPI00286F70E9|nr:uncharacterized protein LOC132201719 [Neocloeon triangulifer]